MKDVRAALRKLRTQKDAKHKARRSVFAKALAEKLGIPVDKVLEALPARGPSGSPHGPGGLDRTRFGHSGPGGPPGGLGGRGGPGRPGGPTF